MLPAPSHITALTSNPTHRNGEEEYKVLFIKYKE
jgi:hypothetical protein